MESSEPDQKTLTDEQVFEALRTAQEDLQVYMQLQQIHFLSIVAAQTAWVPSYSWNDPVGIVLT